MSKPIYPTRTFTLTLKTTETPIGVPAEKRLARALKAVWRGYGFKCVSVLEVDTDAINNEVRERFLERQKVKGETNAKEEK